MMTGLIWFRPRVFGNAWMSLTGKNLQPAPAWMAAGLVGHPVIALVLAVIVLAVNATTLIDGILVGVLVWVGFVVTLKLGELIWERIPMKLFAIRIGNHLVALSVAGAILAVWR